MKNQFTIIGRLVDKSGKLYPRITDFNEAYSNEIERLELFALLANPYTVEITVKKCFDYNCAKVMAEQYLGAFMGERKYTIL